MSSKRQGLIFHLLELDGVAHPLQALLLRDQFLSSR